MLRDAVSIAAPRPTTAGADDFRDDGGLLDLLQREGSVSVMHLADEGELLGKRVKQQIRLGVIEVLLHVRQAKSQVVHGGYEVCLLYTSPSPRD